MGCCNFQIKRQKWKDDKLVIQWCPFFRRIKVVKILMISLDACGKTTLLYQAKLGADIQAIPTIGFNVEQINFDGISMQVWDVGGGHMIRQLWSHYYDGLDAIMYIIDLSAPERLPQSLRELKKVVDHEQAKNKFIFIIGNKQQIAQINPNQILQQVETWQMKQRYKLLLTCALQKQDIRSTMLG